MHTAGFDIFLGKNDSDFNIEQVTCTAGLSTEESDNINNDINVLKLNEIYSGHKDYVLDLITIRRFYENSEYRSSIEKLLNSTVFSNNSIKYPVTIEKGNCKTCLTLYLLHNYSLSQL